MLRECTDLEKNFDAKVIRQSFTDLRDDISSDQKDIVERYWGISEYKSQQEMKLIINETEDLYQKRKNMQISNTITDKLQFKLSHQLMQKFGLLIYIAFSINPYKFSNQKYTAVPLIRKIRLLLTVVLISDWLAYILQKNILKDKFMLLKPTRKFQKF